ncbi:ABC transporter substrate-binding protein [uncultured Veillonella sp.]|uniref:ABC transporter substrate-binding protein n=1 Tax=uncultured Veillonella sp. TaxID=159268 RepID=UPI0025ED93B0|nr:ABC transporter substrate-binding protein [uncultured Veillonella sp.]MDY3973062.1 ABC transporter substrate-binding protein [Veillonella caviae]
MMWKKRVVVALAALMVVGLVAGCGSDSSSGGDKTYKVGIVQLVEHPALDAANKGFVDGLASKGFKDNVKIDQQNAQGDQSNLNSIAQRFVSEREDLVLAIATPAAQSMANASRDIPILGTAITDYVTAKLVESNEKPGGNVSGTTDMNPVEQQVDLIATILPEAKKIGILYSTNEINSQLQAERMKKHAKEKGIEVVEATVSNVNDVQQAAQNLVSQGVVAIYVPTDNIVASSMPNLVKITDSAKIPVFPGEDNLIKTGGLATYSVDYYQLGFQAGVMGAKILSGESKVGDMPIEAQTNFKLVVNEEQAKKLGITIPADVLKEANK